jgi:hypothetical protein
VSTKWHPSSQIYWKKCFAILGKILFVKFIPVLLCFWDLKMSKYVVQNRWIVDEILFRFVLWAQGLPPNYNISFSQEVCSTGRKRTALQDEKGIIQNKSIHAEGQHWKLDITGDIYSRSVFNTKH